MVNIEDEMTDVTPERSPCFVHTLQLVVRDAMDQAGPIKSLMEKVQKLTAFCHKSTWATDILEEGFKLQPANATRWNSQLKMMRSVLRVRSEIFAELNCPIQLTPYKLRVMGELCEALEPFEEATDKCQAEKTVMSSLVITCVQGLRHAAKDAKVTGNNKLITFKLLQTRLTRVCMCLQMPSVHWPGIECKEEAWCVPGFRRWGSRRRVPSRVTPSKQKYLRSVPTLLLPCFDSFGERR
ncbi:hypothetical protein SKAU_G00034120 [Synaphobranchus kaupii]|uniref:Uncharacterized protein n=1 Tax=Synaphobranchus kaupii TaxID=118154 RepID=A0A9Q1JGL3_SYNKA|nr:hypothetical protein SKAU_G00034120 [Synaphobranchus kaupii]